MIQLLQRLPFLGELFFNGSFILLYFLKENGKLPDFIDYQSIDIVLDIGVWFAPLILLFSLTVNYLNSSGFDEFLRRYVFSIMVIVPLMISWGDLQFTFWLVSAHLLSSVFSIYGNETKVSFGARKKFRPGFFLVGKLRPAQIVLISFVGLILAGTVLLMLPISSKDGAYLSFVDALFMSTSATCVTGLVTVPLEKLDTFGQVVILTLIQVGGLGIMTLSSSMAILLGRSMGMKDRIIMQDLLDISGLEDLLAMIVDIIKYTFFIELWGGVVLTFAFTYDGFELGQAIYYGFFHSVSAFCNSGFSLFSTSLESYVTNPLIHGTIAVLVTLGGFGFIVLRELKEMITKRKRFIRTTIHTKIVLIASLVLTIGGAVFIFLGEYLNALDAYSFIEKVQISIFHSVTLRTAGFNTIPMANFHTYTLYAMALFMFIGAGPGSTAGGIKVTTLSILVQSIISTLKGRKRVAIFDRSISPQMVVRATALAFVSIVVTCIFILLLMKLESGQSFLTIFFEVVSAFGTVGLSLGITSFLSMWGKLAISLLMLIGRIGPLTLVLAVGEKNESTGKLDYPDGHVMIG